MFNNPSNADEKKIKWLILQIEIIHLMLSKVNNEMKKD